MNIKKPSKKATPVKKAKPAKKASPAKKSAPAKKATPVKKAKPAKKEAPAEKKRKAKKPAEIENQDIFLDVDADAPVGELVVEEIPVPEKPKQRGRRSKKQQMEDHPVYDKEKLDFARSIAEMMKKSNREAEERQQKADAAIHLSRRPTSRSKGENTMRFPASDLAEFRKRLLIMRQEAIGQSKSMRNVAMDNADSRTADEVDSDVFMRIQNLGQVDSRNKIVQKIEEALRHIDDGTYGICENCGQLIRKPRLMNLPFAHTCMECQNAMEKSRHSGH